MNLYRGLLHVHSTYSYDGRHSIAEIAEFARRQHHDFIVMSEHSDTLIPESVAAFADECNQASDPSLLMMPGIEFTCENNLHLIGLGISEYTATRNPLAVCDFIRERGGVAVIAHPVRYKYLIPLALAHRVNGIEVWNGAYDGRFIPNHRSLILLRRLREHNASLLAYGGEDLHTIVPRFHVAVDVHCTALTPDRILRALDAGDFTISNSLFRLSARSTIGPWQSANILAGRAVFTLAKRIRDRFLSQEETPWH